MSQLNFRQRTILKTDHETQTSDRMLSLLKAELLVIRTKLVISSSVSDSINRNSEIQTDKLIKNCKFFLHVIVDQVDRLNNTILIYDNPVYSDMIQSFASCFHKVKTRLVEVYI